MTDQRVRIRIRLHQPVEESDSTVPSQEGRPPRHRLDDTRWWRKGGRSLLFALGSTLAIGVVIAYVSWPTREPEPSRSEAAGIPRAAIGANGSSDPRTGMGGTQGARTSGSRSSWVLEGPSAGAPDLNLETAAQPATRHESALAEGLPAERAEAVLPALADMKHVPDLQWAEGAQGAARVLAPSRTVEQGDRTKAWVSLPSPQRPEVSSAVDKHVTRSHLTSGMHGREPADRLESSVRLTGDERRIVFYFTELRDLAGHTVVHRWERNGQVLTVLPFKVEGPRWRVYSNITLTSSKRGHWRVAVADTRGTVLASQDFDVVQR